MMGGVHTDINGATPIAGLYAAGEAACVSINGANRLGSNSLPELLVFGARAGRAAADYASGQPVNGSSAAILAQARDEQRRLAQAVARPASGGERIATIRDEMHKAMEQGAGIYRSGDSLERAVATLRSLQLRAADIAIADHSQTFNTERIAALELAFMLDVAEAILNCRVAPGRVARGAPAPGLHVARRRAVPCALAGHRKTPMARAGSSTCRSRSPAGPRASGSTGGSARWRISSRFRWRGTGRKRKRRPTFDEYEVPCPRDWVVLDALNYVKDRLDGTLSYRWSCRMGVCGSCGMSVNGEPKLTCATFLADYAPGPDSRGAAQEFPGHPRPHRRHRRLHAEADDGQAVDRPRARRSRSPRASTSRRRRSWRSFKPFSMCINCMLCYSACPIYSLDPQVHRPGGDRAGAALQPGLARRGREGAAGGALGARRDLGLHVCRRVHEGVPEERRSGRGHPALQARRRARLGQGVRDAVGARDERARSAHAVPPAVATARGRPPTGGWSARRTSPSSCARSAASSWRGSSCTS